MARIDSWTYAGQNIDIVDRFTYLGLTLSSGGSFAKATDALVDKALKAMHALLFVTKNMDMPIDIMFNLFDAYVLPILNYASETWGFQTANNIERVHKNSANGF